MPELQRLRLGHAPALLAFEQANRAYLAASIPDRGDDYEPVLKAPADHIRPKELSDPLTPVAAEVSYPAQRPLPGLTAPVVLEQVSGTAQQRLPYVVR